MEKSAFVITLLIWGVLFLFGMALAFFAIRTLIIDKKKMSFIPLIILFLIIAAISANNFFLVIKKEVSNPEMNNTKKIFINGVTCTQYQDTNHMCNASDRNSTFFTSIVPINGEPQKTDTCIICGGRFFDHNTHREQVYFDWMEELSLVPNQ